MRRAVCAPPTDTGLASRVEPAWSDCWRRPGEPSPEFAFQPQIVRGTDTAALELGESTLCSSCRELGKCHSTVLAAPVWGVDFGHGKADYPGMRSVAALLPAAVVFVIVAGCAFDTASATDVSRAPGLFAFISDDAQPNLGQIFVIQTDGSGFRKLTVSDKEEFDPQWSPDGRKVAFERAHDIWTVGADGTAEHRLTSASRGSTGGPVSSSEPTWSPDGRQIAYVQTHDKSGANALYVMNADGSHERRVLSDVEAPAWSPDGKQILFCRGGYTKDHLFLLELKTRDVRQLTKTRVSECQPDWSPDGHRIAYEQVDANVPGPFVQYDVFVMNADGTHHRNLSRNAATDGNPVWSPDGKQIAFVSDRDGDAAIFIVRADGQGRPRKVTTPPLIDFAIDWAPRLWARRR